METQIFSGMSGKFGSSRDGSTLCLFPFLHKAVGTGCLFGPWQLHSPFSAKVWINLSVGAEILVDNPFKNGIKMKLWSCRIYFHSLQKYTEDSQRKRAKVSEFAVKCKLHTTVHWTQVSTKIVSHFIHISYPTLVASLLLHRNFHNVLCLSIVGCATSNGIAEET